MRDHPPHNSAPAVDTLLQPDPRLWSQAMDAVRDLVFIHDTAGRLLQANRAYCRRAGLPLKELQGRRYWDVFPRRDEALPSAGTDSRDPVGGTRHELLIEAHDGALFLSREYPVTDASGHHTCTMRVLERHDPEADWSSRSADQDRQLRNIVRSVPAAYYSLGVDGCLLDVNDTWLRQMQYERREVIGHAFSDFLVAEERKQFPALFAEFIAQGGTTGHECRLLKRDGTIFDTSIVGTAVNDDEDRFLHSHCILQNVSERSLAEDALRLSEQRLSLALEATDDGIWDFDRETGGFYMSTQFIERLGYAREDVADPRTFLTDHVHPEDGRRAQNLIHQGLTQRRMHLEFEFRLRSRDGGWHWFQARGKAFDCFADGSPRRIVGTLSDITSHKKLVGEILALQRRLQGTIDAMPSILVGVDLNGVVVLWNEGARLATGIGTEHAIGRLFRTLHPFFDGLGDRLRTATRLRQPQLVSKAEIELTEGPRIVDVMVYPYSTDDIDGAVVRIDDVTERSRMEQMLIQTEKMMSIGGLSAGIAHEINNPLGGMLQGLQNVERRLFADLPGNRAAAADRGLEMDALRAYMIDREVPRLLDGIRKSGQRAASIVANMLQFARTSDGELQNIDLAQLIANTVDLAAVDYDLSRNWDFRNISIVLETDPDLPAVPMQPTGIEQVLLNLLGNAAQALQDHLAPGHEPRIVIRTSREGCMARIDVEDNGPGIAPEIRHRIFDPFFTTKPPGVGTGLGLAVSHHIITDIHRGDMTVDSKPGKGATFTIRLPMEVLPS